MSLLFVVLTAVQGRAKNVHALVDDRAITIATPADVQNKQIELTRFIWGEAGFPVNTLPSSVRRDVKSPVPKLNNLKRVETLQITMETGLLGLSHHFIPKRNTKKRLVVLHLGHSTTCTFNDGSGDEPDVGMRRILARLLSQGFPVLAVYMPQITPEDCRWGHNELFRRRIVSGNPMKFFLEPTAASLNYLTKKYHYQDVAMIGLSGGGWTTTVYAAVDPRVRISIPVAGTVPLVMRRAEDEHDMEQVLEEFYQIAGYTDLYVLGSQGVNRRQIQVLNRRDDCCFGELQHNAQLVKMPYEQALRDYEKRVQSVLKQLGSGSFVLYIDDAANRHMISGDTIEKIIMPALRK